MHMIEAAELRYRLPWPKLLHALENMFKSGCEAPLRHRHMVGADNTLLLMPAWQAGSYTGVKIVHVAPGNAAHNLKAVHAAYLLSNANTGVPLALLEGGELTDRRTAAASLLAATHLARPESRRLLILGAGRVATALAEAYAQHFPLTEIALWSRRPEQAVALAAELAAHGLPARATSSKHPGGFDIVSAATLATAPLILGAEVSPGTHVDLVGAFRPHMRESDAALLAAARLVVDTRAGCLAEAGDIVLAMEEGAFTASHIAAELAELCRGEVPGRTSAEQVTVFKSVGWAGEDLAAAILAYQGGTVL